MKINHWINAFRLRTLFLSLSCIWAGLICVSFKQQLDLPISVFNLLTALFLQILSNLANDYGDSIHGADHEDRKGPKRMVQAGLISAPQMKKAMILFAVLSFVSGCCLLYFAMPNIGLFATSILLAVGILSIIAAIAYTNGKNPYGYAGLGDISVFIFFGFVSVLGTQYLQTAGVSENALYLSIAYGCLSVGVLNLNNMRDIESDATASKKSIPVRLGLNMAKKYHTAILIIAWLCLLRFIFLSLQDHQWAWAISFVLLPNISMAVKAKDYQSFDPLLKWLSLSTFLMTIILYVGSL
ncbi:MAG: 1,4-dihydroxy-2-naphthoate octaprenyltransferase [bacterium]|nr:1,4-dihydroxy-2-naphthoate octaprenyltransferase [bacterium]